MAKKADPVGKILDAAMTLAAEKGWRATTLGEVARRADLPLADLYRVTPSKGAILEALARKADAAVLDGAPADPEETPHDRVFDVLMRRFDALTPYREGLRAVAEESARNPLPALKSLRQIRRSMGWMLEAAGVHAGGLGGIVQANGLAAVWLATLRVWFGDDSADLAKTMAALDSNLRRAEEIWRSLPLRRRQTPTTSEVDA